MPGTRTIVSVFLIEADKGNEADPLADRFMDELDLLPDVYMQNAIQPFSATTADDATDDSVVDRHGEFRVRLLHSVVLE